MRNRTLFLLVMAATVLVSLQAWAHDLPQPSVDLTTRIARTTHNGLRAIKNPPSKMIDFATKQASEPEAQTAIIAARRDAAIKAKSNDATSAVKAKEKKETTLKRLAPKPAARLSRSNGPLRTGEVVDDYGVIIKPADGERKVYNRSGQALIYDPSGDQSGWTERTLPDWG